MPDFFAGSEKRTSIVRSRHRGDLSLVGVTHSYGQRPLGNVVTDINFTVPDGDLWTLLGPSGSGKSTLLRFIGGYLLPNQGKVMLDGRDITNVHPRDRDMGMVFQVYALFPHMTVYDNVAFGLEARGIPKAQIRERVGQMLEINRLLDFERRYPHELSGGQQQRVALARALVIRPSALLMDEALGALDLKLRESMAVEIRRIQRDLGTTTIHVTHDQSEAMTMSDRIVVIKDGSVLLIGTPQELSRRPASRFVAEFLGSNNVVPVTLLSCENAVVLGRIEGIEDATALSTHQPERVIGANYFLVLRPEETLVSARGPGIAGTIRATRYSGISRCLVIETPSGITVSAIDPTDQFQIGDAVYVSWRPDQTSIVSEMPEGAEK